MRANATRSRTPGRRTPLRRIKPSGLSRIKHAKARIATTYLLAIAADHAAQGRTAAATESLDTAYRIVVGLPRRSLPDAAKIAITDWIAAAGVRLRLPLKGSHEDRDDCECSGKTARCVSKEGSSCRQFYDGGRPAGCGAL
jgi:hypothetical protein